MILPTMRVEEAFSRALCRLWVRDGIASEESAAIAARIAALFTSGDEGSKAASQLLADSGIRARWNDVLRRDRAAVLAQRIRPLVIEPLLDVLSGDGSVCLALSDLGVADATATERSADYTDSVLPAHVPFQSFPEDFDFSPFRGSTALLSAVLHHEADPARLLDALAQTPISRWIVVENCVTPEFPRSFHQLADLFFNNCLNDFGVHCGDQHRTLKEWTDLLALYGTVTVVDHEFTVPGIPFPYSLLIVSR